MKFKKLLQLDKRKIILFLPLAIFLNLFSTGMQSQIFYFYHSYFEKPYLMSGGTVGCEYRGYPLTFISKCCGDEIATPCKSQFHYSDLIINLVLIYLFLSLFIAIFNWIKKRYLFKLKQN